MTRPPAKAVLDEHCYAGPVSDSVLRAPAPASHDGQAVSRSTGNDRRLNVRSSIDGEANSDKRKIAEHSDGYPALAVRGGQLYIAWGRSGQGPLGPARVSRP